MSAQRPINATYQQTEIGQVSSGWDVVPLGNLFTFKNGLNKAKQYFGYGTPIVNYMDVFQNNGLHTHCVLGRVDVSRDEQKAYEVRKGDVFFTRTSETVNEIGIASVMLGDPQRTVFSGFVLRARPIDDSLDDQFKKYCFSSRAFRQQVTSRASYTTRALTNGRTLAATLLARPPIAEQRAIALALSDADALIASLDALIAKKRDLKQAAMQQLLTGKVRLPGFEANWEVNRLGQYGDFKGGNGFPLRYQGKVAGEFPFLKVSDMNNEGNSMLMFNSNHWISEEARRLLGAQAFPPNSIVFAKIGAAIFLERKKRLVRPSCIDNNMMAYVFKREDVDPSFFYYLFMTIELSKLVAATALPSLNGRDIAALTFAFPQPEEQAAIGSVLSDMDVEIAALEAKRDKCRALKQGMMQELLTGRIRLI